jgi:ABC-type oligopeptide transport system ATPase subunit
MNNQKEIGDMMYVNIRETVNSKPKLIAETENLLSIINHTTDWYRSLYKYTEEQKKRIEETGTVSGIRDTLTDLLFFDFDSKNDIEKARQDALTVANRLLEAGFPEDSIGCFFTGSKGFSLEIKIDELITPEKFKAIVFNIAGDLESFDRVVNDPNRIVRIENTKHNKSGLYKIPLNPEELAELEIDDIRLLAKNPRKIERQIVNCKLPSELDDMTTEKPVETISKELTFDVTSVDMKARPPRIDEARWLLINGFFRTGERNYAMLCIASTLKNLNYPLDVTKGMMLGTAKMQSERTTEDEFPENEIDLILKQVYGPNWKGGQFTTKDPTNWLSKYAQKMGISVREEDTGPMTLVDISPSFQHYAKNYEKNLIKTGIESLDKTIPITVGSNFGIVGAPGVGKTAIALKILKYNSQQNMPVVFASLDMVKNRLFEKVIYNVTGLTREEVYTRYKEGKIDDILRLVKESFGNVWFYDKSSATVEDVKRYTMDVEQKTGQKVKLVMWDYFERLNCDVSDDTAASKKIAGQVQDFVNDMDVASIMLYQPNKMSLGSGPDTEIKSYTAIKGSSFVFQSLRGIITLNRPFYTPETKDLDNYMIMNVVKNDLGELARLKYGWKGKTGEIYELEDHEKDELDQLIKLKKATKDEKAGWE